MSSIRLALDAARLNPITDLPKMAAILMDGRFSFVGYNSRKTHPLQARYAKHPKAIEIHAEIAAIAKAVRRGNVDLSSFTLTVARVKRDGSAGLAKPCLGCLRAAKAFNIKHIEWTDEENG